MIYDLILFGLNQLYITQRKMVEVDEHNKIQHFFTFHKFRIFNIWVHIHMIQFLSEIIKNARNILGNVLLTVSVNICIFSLN